LVVPATWPSPLPAIWKAERARVEPLEAAEPAPEMLTTRRSARTGSAAEKSPAPEIETRVRSRDCTSTRTRFESQNRQAPPWSMRRRPLRTSSTHRPLRLFVAADEDLVGRALGEAHVGRAGDLDRVEMRRGVGRPSAVCAEAGQAGEQRPRRAGRRSSS
jgi:hypothetical protein